MDTGSIQHPEQPRQGLGDILGEINKKSAKAAPSLQPEQRERPRREQVPFLLARARRKASPIAESGVPADAATPDQHGAALEQGADAGAAADFLCQLVSTGLIAVCAIVPDGPVRGETYELPGGRAALQAWIEAGNGKANLYYTLNAVAPRSQQTGKSGRAASADVTEIRGTAVDIDARKDADFKAERGRLLAVAEEIRTGPVTPSAIVDTGGGIQVVWLFPTPLAKTPENVAAVEAQARALAQRYGGDAVHSPEHLYRIPHTVNLPDRRKRERGRVKAATRCLLVAPDVRHNLSALAELAPPVSGVPQDSVGPIDVSQAWHVAGAPEKLDPDLKARLARARERHPTFERLLEREIGPQDDRSARDYAIAAACVESGIIDGPDIADIVAAYSPEKFEEQGDAYLARTVAKALKNAKPLKRGDDWFEPQGTEPATETADRTLPFVTLAESAASALTRGAKPLIKGILDQGAMTILYGESNTGKTFVAMDLAYHVAAGKPWGGMKVTAFPVVYVAAEGGVGVDKRSAALERVHGPAPGFFLVRRQINLLRADADVKPLIDTVDLINKSRLADGARVGLVVIDTLSRAMAGGDENSSTDMGVLVRHFDIVRSATGAHLLVVHHSGKDRARGARGHSLLRAATDTEIEIGENQITVQKQRDIDKSFASAFALTPVELDKDADGEVVTSCVVRLVGRNVAVGVATPAEEKVLEAIEHLTAGSEEGKKRGIRTAELIEYFKTGSDKMSEEAVRSHVKRLRSKNLIQSKKRGMWTICPNVVESYFVELEA